MQRTDLRIECAKPTNLTFLALALTLSKLYLLTFPVEGAKRMLNKGFKIVITNLDS